MGRPKKEPVEIQEVEKAEAKQTVKPKSEPKDKVLLQEIAKLEDSLKAKRKEYSEYIASKRIENKQLSVAECLKLAMRDDANSERKKLERVTAIAVQTLKNSK